MAAGLPSLQSRFVPASAWRSPPPLSASSLGSLRRPESVLRCLCSGASCCGSMRLPTTKQAFMMQELLEAARGHILAMQGQMINSPGAFELEAQAVEAQVAVQDGLAAVLRLTAADGS